MFDRSVVDALPVGFCVVDRDGRYEVFNAAAKLLVQGGDVGELIGLNTKFSLFHPDDRPMAREDLPIMRAFRGATVRAAPVVVKSVAHPEGRRITVSASPIRDATGSLVGAVAVFVDEGDHDVTEDRLRKTQELLERSQKMEAIGRLAGSVAHDFNNLLTVILSYSQMMGEALPEGELKADSIQIRRAAERGSALTRQLSMLSHQTTVQRKVLDPAEVINGLRGILGRLLGPRIELVTTIAAGLRIHIDPGQLEQVLINLMVNARDAMRDRGRIVVSAIRASLDAESATLRGLAAGSYVELAVTDDGAGMDAETQRRIFDPFFTTKESGKGTGLGLAIVHGIIGQAGGAITVHSEVGHGTTFRVYLPVSLDGEITAPLPIIGDVELPPITVLVVEDDEQVRSAAARALRAAGCTVLETGTVEDARRQCVAYEGDIAVLVTDIVVSDGRGDLLARELVQLRPELRVVFASGYAGSGLAIGKHSARLLPKPFTPGELRRVVASALEQSRSATPATQARPMRVLIVDDDEVLRRTIGRLVRRSGAEVVEAASGRAGVTALSSGAFDVVLSDVNMPDGDGLELLRSIRRIDLDIPVILATGMPNVASAAEAIEYGAFRYLTKPFDSEGLVKTLRHASRMHALARLRREANGANGSQAKLVADRAGLEVRFDGALDAMWMAYQPIVDARTGALFGVEALLRSDDPLMRNPQTILDAAQELGRLPQLGRRVRATVAAAPLSRELALFVNLHPDDLFDHDLIAPESALAAIAKHVVLEVTERASLPASGELAARVARLRALGFRIAVDDIGAGYSGLASFADLEPEIVKIDMALVRDVHLSTVRQRTVRSLCSLCHEMGTLVVGECVETEAERDCLVSLGCDLFQGYLFGKPRRELPGT